MQGIQINTHRSLGKKRRYEIPTHFGIHLVYCA